MENEVILSRNKQRAISALLTNATVKGAAAEIGVTRETVQRYLADPVFKGELDRHLEATATGITAGLIMVAGESVEVLHEILGDKDAENAVKVRAALGVLNQMSKNVGLVDEAPVVNIQMDARWMQVRAVLVEALEPFPEVQAHVVEALKDARDRA